jgi:hypothetical protein
VRAARHLAADVLAASDFPGDVETVLLLLSELVTNAVRHAATPFELHMAVDAAQVTVTVIDHDRAHPPHLRHPRPEETSGRGLRIVDRLASSWGSEVLADDAKGVWFRCLATTAATAPVSSASVPAGPPAAGGPAAHPSARPARR